MGTDIIPEGERDENGNLTDMALAIDALIDFGCDCGDDNDPPCLGCLCEKALRTERKRALAAESKVSQMVEAIKSEPELPGEMPDYVWNLIKNDRDLATESLRIAVRRTKAGILVRAGISDDKSTEE